MKLGTNALSAALLLTVMVSGCSAANTKPSEAPKEPEEKRMLDAEDLDPMGGADLGGANNHEPKYWTNPDFYNMESDDQVTILTHFKTMQQTTEYTCGPSSVTMCLNYLGIPMNEWDAAVGMKCSVDEDTENALPGSANSWHEPGANVKKMVEYLNTVPGVKVIQSSYIENPTPEQLVQESDYEGLVYSPAMLGNIKKTFESASLYASENSADTEAWVEDAKDSYFVQWLKGNLEAGNPIIIHTSSWNGHFTVIVGYDSMGTPQIGDDALIIADPYDTWDGNQDGFIVVPLEKQFYEWYDFNIAAKPYQVQPFVVVGKE